MSTAPCASPTEDPRQSVARELALTLHRCGTTAHRLEQAVDAVGEALGVPMDCFSSPTALFVGRSDGPVRLLRVAPADFHGAALVAVDAVGRELAAGTLSPQRARLRLRSIAGAMVEQPLTAATLAFATTSAACAVLLGGAGPEVALGGLLGGGAAVSSRLLARAPGVSRLALTITASSVAISAALLSQAFGASATTVTLAALIVFVPGLSLTMALAELVEGHLISGTARLAAVGVTFVQLALGAALGWQLVEPPPAPAAGLLPGWAEYASLAVAPLAIAALMRVRPRDLPAIAVASWLGVAGARWGTAHLGADLGPFAGAFAVGLAGNVYARLRRVPATVVLVPGILLLVPGSMGFHATTALLQAQTLGGVAGGFSALVVAASLVGGLVVAQAAVPVTRQQGRRGFLR